MSEHDVLFDAPGPRTIRRFRIINIIALLLIVGIIAWVVVGLRNQGQITTSKWEPFLTGEAWTSYYIPGVLATFRAAGVSIVLALVFGIVFGLGRLSQLRLVRAVCSVVVEFFRAVPVLLMMLFSVRFYSYYDLVDPPQLPLYSVVTALTLYNGAVIAELVRSGVHSLAKGQREAGLAIGLTYGQTLRSVLLPQALVAMAPSIVSQMVVIVKDSALGYIIGYSELLRQGNQFGVAQQTVFPSYIVSAAIFIVINAILAFAAHSLARRLRSRTGAAIAAGTPQVGGVGVGGQTT
ncbi:amino acid ABC transporter permease [Phytoactinopolyspora endophytica]|uniref:amino acid ABC transporter permease n=1 Tax=Phytoactinopolyspora endophytica TaxID=1642495 RepID=UPI00101D0E2A|nr:amino acid ABC transporter permease [Phytoactinopolyspora endophytica]